MKKYLMTAVSILALCACGQEKKVPEVAEATPEQVTRVEPPCWWAGMKTDLQLLVQGPAISDYDVRIFGDAEVAGVHKAESPNYLFVCQTASPTAIRPMTIRLILTTRLTARSLLAVTEAT